MIYVCTMQPTCVQRRNLHGMVLALEVWVGLILPCAFDSDDRIICLPTSNEVSWPVWMASCVMIMTP